MKKISSAGLTLIMAMSLTMSAFAAMPSDEVINDLYKFKIISDTSDIRADDHLTRAEAVKMLYLASNGQPKDNVEAHVQIYSDVPVNHWAAEYIELLTTEPNRKINGYEDNTFRPEGNVTNQELQKMIVCILGYNVYFNELGAYPDVYLSYANNFGINKGINLDNEAYATRGDAMQMIYNALDIPIVYSNGFEYDKYGNIMPEIKLLDGVHYDFVSFRKILNKEVEW